MKVRVDHWQAVWEKTTAYVDIPDEELVDEYADLDTGARDWIEDNWHEWLEGAHIEIEDSVEGMDSTLSVRPEVGSGYRDFSGEGT